MLRSWKARGALGAALVAVAALFSLAPIARSKAISAAHARGAELQIGSSSVGLLAVTLSDVNVMLEGVSGLSVHLAKLDVDLTPSFGVKRLSVRGGEVRYSGRPEQLADDLAAWRERHTKKDGGAPSEVTYEGEQLAITLLDPSAEATGIRFHRQAGKTSLACDSARFRWHESDIVANKATLSLIGSKVELADVATLELQEKQEPPAGKTLKETKDKDPKDKDPKESPDPPPVTLAFPKLGVLRAMVDSIVSRASAKMTIGGAIDVRALGIRFSDGLRIGPGTLHLDSPKAETIDVKYSSGSEQGKPSLSFHLEAGLGVDDRAELAGGPLPFKLLGVEEGAGGIIDVDKATLTTHGTMVLSARGDSLTFDGAGTGKHIGIKNRRLSNEPVRGLDLEFRARGILSAEKELRLDEAMVALGALRVEGRGTLMQKQDHIEAQAAFGIPSAPCDVLLKSLPEGLVPDLVGMSLDGNFGLKGRLAFVSTALDDLSLDVRLDNECKFRNVPAPLRKDRFSAPFLQRVYSPEGELMETEMGPGTSNWSAIDDISPFMQVAVLTTEDGAFMHHHGVSFSAIRNALVANLKAGRFIRGASTITMQLAKNLFLVRDKTLSRKMEELVLTYYLEETFKKVEMMELYLNIIEFGPNIYGVTDAAAHYFGRRPSELNLAECMFLAKMLPKPNANHWVYEKGLPDSWLREIQSYMRTAHKLGKLNDAELKDGLAETIVFQKEGAAPPVHRKPIRGSHLAGDDDADWQPMQ